MCITSGGYFFISSFANLDFIIFFSEEKVTVTIPYLLFRYLVIRKPTMGKGELQK
jgi:hypothetical protein